MTKKKTYDIMEIEIIPLEVWRIEAILTFREKLKL
jgi:hypothetical protein